MLRGKKIHPGFRIANAVIVAAASGVVGITGLLTYHQPKSTGAGTVNNVASVSPQSTVQPETTSSTVSTSPQVYSNTMRGFSFSYPANWAPAGDVVNDPKTSATRQEFGVSLRPNTGTSSTNTAELEILDEPLATAETWYDQFYAQTPIKVSKTTNTLKGRQSVQYDFVAPTYEKKQYLIAVGSKTYLFSSVNESLNTTASPSYWSNFNNTFASLAIQG